MSNDALYVNEQASNDGSRLRFNRAKRGAPRPKPDSQRPKRPKSIIQERRHKEQILSHCFFSSPASTRWSLWSGSTGQDRHEAEWRENSKSEFGMDKVQTGELLKYEAVSLTSQTFRLFAFFPAPGESSFADFGYFSLAFIFSRSYSERTRRTMARMNSQ